MKERIAIIDGLRSPIAKAYGQLKDLEADSLGAIIAKELVLRIGIDYKEYDEVIIGNVAQPFQNGRCHLPELRQTLDKWSYIPAVD